jgi:signal transduction histidine kinase
VSRIRHLVTVVVAALPLLALSLATVWTAGPVEIVTAIALWIVGVAVVAGAVWRESVLPASELFQEVGTTTAQHARWKVREITDQATAAEGERAALAQLLEDLSNSLGEGLMVVTSDLRVRLANPRALHFAGRQSIEPGTHVLDVLRNPEMVEAVRRAAGGEAAPRVMVENPRGVWEVRPFPIRQGGAVVLLTEVGLVRRSAELRRRFVQDLSHELRSPLAVMRTTVEAMEGEVAPQLGEMMVRQVDRITRLTDELYELATIEAGQIELRPEEHEIDRVVHEVVGDFTSVAAAAEVKLDTDVPEGLTAVFDRRGLMRVLSNLIDNAVKYNRRGGWVRVRADEGPSTVHVEVADSGLGIPADELKAVMQRFYRLDRARTPGRGGLGLGLAIVKHMVQQLGGNLTLDSREDVGTVVTVSLPKLPHPPTEEIELDGQNEAPADPAQEPR